MIYNDLALFTAVARTLSFSSAAGASGIPLSRVSRRIAELEQRLGVRLFERTTRQVRLTEEGRHLLDHCQGAIEALENIASFAADTQQQVIRITAPPLAARTTIGSHLLEFATQNPQIVIDLTTTNTMLDFYRDNIDLAFRLGPLHDSSLVARWLWSVPYCFCAGPAFLAKYHISGPIPLDGLLDLPAIVSRQAWILDSGKTVRPMQIAHELDDLDLIREAARRNMGVAMLPRDMVDGTIQELAVLNVAPLQREMFAVYPSSRLLPARVRKLVEHMASARHRRPSALADPTSRA
jgi:DNA-binding transcriptional LysR family regulator